MTKKWLSAVLAAIMVLGAGMPALAAEGLEAPPATETVQEEAPVAEEAPLEEVMPEEEVMPVEEEAPIEDAPETAAAQGVTVNLTGVIDPVDTLVFEDMAGEMRRYSTYDKVTIPTSVSVRPGSEVRLFMDAAYDVAVDNATVEKNHLSSIFYSEGPGDNGHQRYVLSTSRNIYLTAPQQGTVTVNVVTTQDPLPELIPRVFYNNKWYGYDEGGGIVGGVDPDDPYEYGGIPALTLDDGTITTGGVLEIWTAPGFEMEVLEGGHIVDTHEPTGPAASDIPAGSTAYVLMVDYGAKAFVIACVKQGEHYQIPGTVPQGGTVPEADDTTQTGGTFTDVASDVWYADPIEKAYSSGIVKGVAESTFSPNSATTRGQTVTMLYRLAGSPAAASAASIASYTDGDAVQGYAKDAVAWATGSGLLTGYGDGSLKPGATATRAEVCALIMRFLGK